MTTSDARSNFAKPQPNLPPPETQPCKAPEGHFWVHAFDPHRPSIDALSVGKWLIRVQCQYVEHCWDCVRRATQEGTLGIAAKVSTDWGNINDPAGPWKDHTICVFTYDWHDRGDVIRVARRLKEVDAVRKQILRYKPDAMTYGGIYSENAPGEVAIFEMKPPYEELRVREQAVTLAEASLAQLVALRAAGHLPTP